MENDIPLRWRKKERPQNIRVGIILEFPNFEEVENAAVMLAKYRPAIILEGWRMSSREYYARRVARQKRLFDSMIPEKAYPLGKLRREASLKTLQRDVAEMVLYGYVSTRVENNGAYSRGRTTIVTRPADAVFSMEG